MHSFLKEKTKYSIPLFDDFDVCMLDSVDSALSISNFSTTLDKLHNIPGVSEVEFNGHFGNNVYLTIDISHDNKKTKSLISEIINSSQYLYKKNFNGHPYLVFIGKVSANDMSHAAFVFSEKFNFSLEHIDIDNCSVYLKPNRSYNSFEYFIVDNKDSTFSFYSSN